MTYVFTNKEKALLKYATSKPLILKGLRRGVYFVVFIGIVFLLYFIINIMNMHGNSDTIGVSYKHILKRHVYIMLILCLYLIGILGAYARHLRLCKFLLKMNALYINSTNTATNIGDEQAADNMTFVQSESVLEHRSLPLIEQLSHSMFIANKSLRHKKAVVACYAVSLLSSYVVLSFIVYLLLTLNNDMIIMTSKRLSAFVNMILSAGMIYMSIVSLLWHNRENKLCSALSTMVSAIGGKEKNIDNISV